MGGSGKRWKILTVRGIPFYVSTSWFVIAALYVFVGYDDYSRSTSSAEALMVAVLFAVLFFGSVLVHEAAHAVTARLFDLQVSGVTLVFWGGATETKASAKGPLAEFLVAFVGPATTLALAGAFWVGEMLTNGNVAEIMGRLAGFSLLFAGFNALPGFPLDGGRVLLAAVWGLTGSRRTAMRVAGYGGIAVGMLIGAAAVWTLTTQDSFTFMAFFLGYVAFILISTGRAMDQRIAFRDQLITGTVTDAMRPAPPSVPIDISLAQALDDYLRGADGQAFPVMEDGRVVGTVSIESARRVGARDPMRPVRDGVRPLTQTPVVAPDETLDDALEWLGGRDGLVLRDGVLVGALSPGDVERWYRREVEGRSDADTDVVVPARPDL
ncbi:MAG: CBS domain-containing protein [Actinomycetota bacterium]|nr:CBS domain-containing protein [Actinomycetota bacterium]